MICNSHPHSAGKPYRFGTAFFMFWHCPLYLLRAGSVALQSQRKLDGIHIADAGNKNLSRV